MKCTWMKDAIVPVLAFITIVAGFATLWVHPELKTETIGIMTLVLAFFFGSSKGSQDKDQTIKEKLEAPQGPVG